MRNVLRNDLETARTEMARPAAHPGSPDVGRRGGGRRRLRGAGPTPTPPSRTAPRGRLTALPSPGSGRGSRGVARPDDDFERMRLTAHLNEQTGSTAGKPDVNPPVDPGRSHRFVGTGPALQRSRTALPVLPAARPTTRTFPARHVPRGTSFPQIGCPPPASGCPPFGAGDIGFRRTVGPEADTPPRGGNCA